MQHDPMTNLEQKLAPLPADDSTRRYNQILTVVHFYDLREYLQSTDVDSCCEHVVFSVNEWANSFEPRTSWIITNALANAEATSNPTMRITTDRSISEHASNPDAVGSVESNLGASSKETAGVHADPEHILKFVPVKFAGNTAVNNHAGAMRSNLEATPVPKGKEEASFEERLLTSGWDVCELIANSAEFYCDKCKRSAAQKPTGIAFTMRYGSYLIILFKVTPIQKLPAIRRYIELKMMKTPPTEVVNSQPELISAVVHASDYVNNDHEPTAYPPSPVDSASIETSSSPAILAKEPPIHAETRRAHPETDGATIMKHHDTSPYPIEIDRTNNSPAQSVEVDSRDFGSGAKRTLTNSESSFISAATDKVDSEQDKVDSRDFYFISMATDNADSEQDEDDDSRDIFISAVTDKAYSELEPYAAAAAHFEHGPAPTEPRHRRVTRANNDKLQVLGMSFEETICIVALFLSCLLLLVLFLPRFYVYWVVASQAAEFRSTNV